MTPSLAMASFRSSKARGRYYVADLTKSRNRCPRISKCVITYYGAMAVEPTTGAHTLRAPRPEPQPHEQQVFNKLLVLRFAILQLYLLGRL